VFAGEDVQRQVAVFVVVAVKEAPLLLAVQFHVGGVQVEHDLLRRRLEGLQKHCDQQRVQAVLPVRDLLVAMRVTIAQFQPVQGALAGQRLVHLRLAGEHVQQRVLSELFVVVEVLVAQRQRIDTLRHHLGDRMGDQNRVPTVEEALRQARQEVQTPVGFPQQERATVAGHRAAVERGADPARKMPFKLEFRLATLCHSKGRLFLALTAVWKLSYAMKGGFLLVPL
jgi:hypothetical protein